MRSILIALTVVTMSPAAQAEPLWQEGCFYREYSARHLADHPQQQVTALAIRLTGGPPSQETGAIMDIFARVRPIAGHSLYAKLENGASNRARLSCSVEAAGRFGMPSRPVTMCGNPNACSLDEWVRLTELGADHAVIEDGSYQGAGSVPFPIGDDPTVYIGEEVECGFGDAACNAANPSVRYRMERADPKVCAAIFDGVGPATGCGS